MILALLFSFVVLIRSQQTHIALTENADEMSVTWTTSSSVNKPLVRYGSSPSSLSMTAQATTESYSVGGYTSGSINTALLTGLQSGKTYYYRAGDASGTWFTSVNSFETSRQYPIRFVATGDIGTPPECKGCPQTFKEMLKAHQEMPLDFVLHSGDISYANGNQTMWDDWEMMIQPVAQTIPYMVTVGNHEVYDNFVAYQKRFTMPQSPAGEGNFFYSFDFGPVHFIGLDSESSSFKHHLAQYQFLEADLAAVDRETTPWVFASFHRPWYSSKRKDDPPADEMRSHYEKLFHKYSVDVNFNGHNHYYERLQPMYNGAIDPTGLITLITGNGGTKAESEKAWIHPQPDFSVTRTNQYGIGVATVYNATHMHWQMILHGGQVFDDWWLKKK